MEQINLGNEVSIAIHPFENLTEREGLDGLCKSFHIDLLTEFSRFRQFKIVPHELLSTIGVVSEYSFKGSFRYQNDKLKINAQLINNHKNSVTWADWHELDKEAIYSIQEDLLKQVITALQLQVNYDLLIRLRKKSPSHFTVYEHWLFGMEELKKGSLEADEKARKHFQHALEIDPSYSLGYSGMSLTYFNEWSCQLWERWELSQKGAYDWAKKAIELDEQNYMAALVLGRIYLYEAEFDIAEYYLRKALRLNPNDTDCVMQIASCFIFLGHLQEAEELYEKAPDVSQLKNTYAHIGAFIAFEQGDFKKSIALGVSSNAPWVDFSALMAAVYFEQNDFENMQRYWNTFLDNFQQKIMKGESIRDNNEAIQWLVNVNPFKVKSRLTRFWEYMSNKEISLSPRSFLKTAQTDTQNMFLKADELWQLSFDGKIVRMNEVKGLLDLVQLLRNPEKQIHCSELMESEVAAHSIPVFDEKAKRSYQKRILELQEEIRLTENNNDTAQASALQQEYDDILEHLTTSLGLKGKIRKVNDPMEKVRSAVTWRIRNAIQKITKLHPVLGKHLSSSVKTGIFCSYSPEKPVQWLLD
jgi:TolB-like protein